MINGGFKAINQIERLNISEPDNVQRWEHFSIRVNAELFKPIGCMTIVQVDPSRVMILGGWSEYVD